jgi:HlyD family secretion protein
MCNSQMQTFRWMPGQSFPGQLFCVVVCCVASGCSSAATDAVAGDDVDAVAETAAARPPALVRVQTIRRQKVAPRITAVGTVRARYSSIVASGSEGVVDEFPVELGEYVKSGSLLSKLRLVSTELQLDQQRAILAERAAEYALLKSPRAEDVDESRALLDVAEAVVANARRRADELLQLQKSQAVGDSAVRDGQNELIEATKSLDAAKAVFRRTSAGAREEQKLQAKARLDAQQFQVKYLEAEKAKRFTRAPFDGFVAQRHSYVGQWLSKGSPVITLLKLDEVDVQVLIDQEFVSQVQPGKSVSMKIVGASNSGDASEHWSGIVDSVVSQSEWESGSRSFPVVIRITNVMRGTPENPQPVLREGMMAEAEFFGEEVDAIMVPKDSMVRTSRGAFVFAINPAVDGQPTSVRQVLVTPGISKEDWIEVRGTDLVAGSLIVTEGAERLRSFQSVQVMDPEP